MRMIGTRRSILGGAGQPWTPFNLPSGLLVAWWDAQYTTSLALSGSNVTSWTDRKSGIAVTQATGASQPTWSASARNGKPGISFNGTTSVLLSAASPGVPATAAAFSCAVAGFANTANFGVLLSWDGTASGPAIREIGQEPAYFFNGGGQANGTTWSGVDKFAYGSADGVSTMLLFEDGNSVAIGSSAYTPTAGDGTQPISIGQRNGLSANGWFNGTVQQALIFSGALTASQRQKLEGWESWYDGKNGSNLPAGHPYKFKPPTVNSISSGGNLAGLPPDVAASGLITRQAFFDDFTSLSTIDTTDTGAPGFNWYVHNAWPNAASPQGNWSTITSSAATPAGDLSIAGSVLTMSSTVNPTGLVLASAVYAGGSAFNGNVFGGGGYFEVSMAFDPSLASSNVSWPAFWSAAIEFLTGNATRFVEPDFFEGFPTGTGTIATIMTLHDWDNVALVNYQNSNLSVTLPGGTDFTQMHRYGTWWVPASKNNGVGLIRRYFDGVFVTENRYSVGAGGNPAFDNGNPTGVFSEIDNQHLMLVISCGHLWPSHFDYVSVWQ